MTGPNKAKISVPRLTVLFERHTNGSIQLDTLLCLLILPNTMSNSYLLSHTVTFYCYVVLHCTTTPQCTHFPVDRHLGHLLLLGYCDYSCYEVSCTCLLVT